MLKGEIANSKNMASLRICPRVDTRTLQKIKNLIKLGLSVGTDLGLGLTGEG